MRAMDLAPTERSLRSSVPSAILVDPRLVRRVIKRHRDLGGLGLHVPHARCYAIRRDVLLSILEPHDLGDRANDLPPEVILLSRPAPDELNGATPGDVLAQLWRAAFHALVHVALERRMEQRALTDAMIRERIDRIGQLEFDEIRSVLRYDDLLLPPYDNREAYTEFTALYLELRHFTPDLIARMFPALGDLARVDAAIAPDLDAHALLEGCRPEGATLVTARAAAAKGTPATTFSALPTIDVRVLGRRAPTRAGAARLVAKAAVARAKGNVVRAALLCTRAAAGAPSAEQTSVSAAARADLESLCERLTAALRARDGQAQDIPVGAYTIILAMLAEAAESRGGLRHPIESRLLEDLQRACVAHERVLHSVDLVTWALSLGKRPLIRPLPMTREVQIARHIRSAAAKLRHTHLSTGDRKLLGKLLRHARERADENVRCVLRPAIVSVLATVGLQPRNVPERVATRKLVEELLDQAVAQGFLSLGHLRDALSRNQLKLPDLSAHELVRGDPLLEADRLLGVSLDGVHRRGEIYLRGLQKLSSIPFGTRIGRWLTLYLILPAVGAFVLLDGASHLIGPVSGWLGFGEVYLLTPVSFGVAAVVLFGLLHSSHLRDAAKLALSALRFAFVAVFWRLPRWVLRLRAVRRVLSSKPVRVATRYVVVPLLVAGVIDRVTPLDRLGTAPQIGVTLLIAALASLMLNSKLGLRASAFVVDFVERNWRAFSRRVLPGLFVLIVSTFKLLTDLLERGIYAVDEWLRFRDRGHPLALAAKAALGLGWFFIAYVVRLYIVLLIEPEVNPVKHFPVVTVAHKILLPFSAVLLDIIQTPFRPLGPVVANAIAAPTVFLLPAVFGFLAWELKENWRLYRGARPTVLRPTAIGEHGETMAALLRPGFHSGTLPKLHAKLRRSARQAAGVEGGLTRIVGGPKGASRSRGERALVRHQEELRAHEESVRKFIDRELCVLLSEAPRWPLGRMEVRGVDLGSNRVRIEVVCPSISQAPCTILLEEQSGMLVAGIPEPGWLDALPGGAAGEARFLVENALAGVYQLAGVDLVREQIEAALDGHPPYDISDEGLVVWPGQGYRTEVIYRLSGRPRRTITPRVRGEAPAQPPPKLDERQILYRHQRIRWADWVAAWSSADTTAPVLRMVRGASILPMSGGTDRKATRLMVR